MTQPAPQPRTREDELRMLIAELYEENRNLKLMQQVSNKVIGEQQAKIAELTKPKADAASEASA